MKLKLALQSDMGDALTTSGQIGFVGIPHNMTGNKENGTPYDFWSQFIVLNDGEDSIGASLTFDAQGDCILEKQKGQNIKVKGLMASYKNKKGETKLKIDKAKLTIPLPIDTSKPNTASSVDTQTSIIRQCCIKAAAHLYNNVAKSASESGGRDAMDVIIAAKLFEGYVLGKPNAEKDTDDDLPF